MYKGLIINQKSNPENVRIVTGLLHCTYVYSEDINGNVEPILLDDVNVIQDYNEASKIEAFNKEANKGTVNVKQEKMIIPPPLTKQCYNVSEVFTQNSKGGIGLETLYRDVAEGTCSVEQFAERIANVIINVGNRLAR